MDTQTKGKTKNTRTLEYVGYLVSMLLVTFFPIFIGDTTIDYKLFVHDFTEPDILRKFSYHLALMLQPTIAFWIIFRHTKDGWDIIALITFLWFVKDSADVIYNNNVSPTILYDAIGYSLIVISTLIWAKIR